MPSKPKTHTPIHPFQLNIRYQIRPNPPFIIKNQQIPNKIKHTNLILGSTEWRNVVGSETYWQMGLAVAPEISLRNFSAPKALVGKTFTHHGLWLLSLAAARIWRLNLGFACIRVLFSELGWVKFGAIRVLGLGFRGKEGNVTVVTAR